MVKPEFWSSQSLKKVSLEARLLFIGIWNFCDDYGVCLDSNRKLLGEIFPLDEEISEKRVEKWKKELVQQGLLLQVEYNSTKFLIVRNWREHQKVDNPSTRRWLEDEIIEKFLSEYRDSIETVDSPSLSKEKEKEKEKGKGEGGVETHPLQIFISKELPTVSKLKEQLTWTQSEKLMSEFGENIIKEVLSSMENYKPLLTKYKSVNLTLRNWLKIRMEKSNGKSTDRKKYDYQTGDGVEFKVIQ